MLDLSYFQNRGNTNTQVFTNEGYWAAWNKPRGAKFVNILCVGAGGGGGAGFTGAGGSGGGGACGGYTRANFQASVLPDILYVYTGIGGNGGISGGAASSAGERSFVSIIPNTGSVSNLVCVSSATNAGGGAVGTAAAGAGGTAPTIAQPANAAFLHLGSITINAGIAGGVGVTNANGTTITPSTFITPGASGGGSSTASTARSGGNIATTGPFPQITGGTGTTGSNVNGTRGADGVVLYYPTLIFTGGAGGGNGKGASNSSGGAGGNGSYGCGGGSGAGGTTSGGNGGNGGDGIVIITTSF